MSEVPARTAPVCPRHPERISYLACQRCGRPTCPECQIPAPVGFHCRDCMQQAQPTAVQRSRFGGVVTPGTRVTFTLMALCAVIYLLQRIFPQVSEMGEFSAQLGLAQPWRFLTSAFLHSETDVMHLIFNLAGLYVMGQFLEPLLGRARFIALYLLSAVGGSVGYLLLAAAPVSHGSFAAWTQTMVGASGAVFGLFGAAIVVLVRTGSSVRGMLFLVAINLALPLIYPNIAWQAHLGGLLVGLACAAVLVWTGPAQRRRWSWPGLIFIGCVILGAAVLKYALVLDAYLGLRYGV
ncbi:rhomboid family intramembrane serine protease [Gephyromycinifex aptenodytis]|uniref:rhomboid family intramembrane serine protease n=1 Tax=Gephyromycinifex aptenodytis TaxID=2716227 RepID=UPI001D032DBC|nr:rhomboid family intramembrane serine protease [Gephyromycinifex aptenodytis]